MIESDQNINTKIKKIYTFQKYESSVKKSNKLCENTETVEVSEENWLLL